MITLYATAGSGNCFKPFLAMRQLSIPFRIHPIDVLTGETRGEAFLAINPAGKVPYLKLPGGNGLGESNAMLWYLAEGTPLLPPSALVRGQILQWLFYEQAKLEPFISPARFLTTILPEKGVGRGAEIAAWQTQATAGLAVLDSHLDERMYVAGEVYSIADIGVFGYVHLADEAGVPLAAYPAVERWIARVVATPGFVPIMAMMPQADPPGEQGLMVAA